MTKRLRALLQRRETALKAAQAITDSIGDEEDMDDEQQADFDAHIADVEKINSQINNEETLAAHPLEITPADPGGELDIRGGDVLRLQDPRLGWDHLGQYAQALVRAGAKGGAAVVDDRLIVGAAAPGTNFANEAVGEEGGYLVPPEFANTIRAHSLEDDALLPFTQNDPVAGNSLKIPVDETTPWGTAGIRAYWEGEAGLVTNTKPSLEQRELRLKKLFGLVPITDEIMADSTFMASYLPRKLGESIRYKTSDAIVNGAGAGVPQGFTQSGALVTQAAEVAQVADTIVAENIAKMYARCINPTNGIWLINPDAFPQVITMVIGNQPIWTAPTSGLKEAPNGLLMGRPLIMHETCQTLGDAGDIYFVALNWYQTITKGQGIDFATSMHLWFDYDMTAFRATFRVDGQSVVRSVVTPPNSAITRSPFVRLAARA